MKADPFPVGAVLRDPKRFVVPIYQRTYTWTKEKQLQRFFDSIEAKANERLGDTDASRPHYMGAVLLSPRGKFTFGSIPVFDVVDGQQRLTTFLLFLAAMRHSAIELDVPHLARQLDTLLLNADSPLMVDRAAERYKLWATAYDRNLIRDLFDKPLAELRSRYTEQFYKNGKVREDAARPLRHGGTSEMRSTSTPVKTSPLVPRA